MKGEAAPGSGSMGFPWKTVKVQEVTEGTALVEDQFGKTFEVSAFIRRGKGLLPRAGEEWIIDRTLGAWTFAAVVQESRPIVTGSTDGLPALASLIEALEELGLIEDQTTSARIRATHPHTHTETGTTTGADTL